MLVPLGGVGAAGLERLHPARPLAAQAQRDAGPSERAVGRVEVDRLQVLAPRRGRLHGRAHGRRTLGRHLELQLGFEHGGSGLCRQHSH
ncbi:MAG: hypothetical protein U1F53_11020 [Burkholderiaceae bacterium]